MEYCEEYKSYEYQRNYIRNSLDLICLKPCEFTVDSLYETIIKNTPGLIKGCHTNRVKKILNEWLPEAQSKQRTIELFDGIV